MKFVFKPHLACYNAINHYLHCSIHLLIHLQCFFFFPLHLSNIFCLVLYFILSLVLPAPTSLLSSIHSVLWFFLFLFLFLFLFTLFILFYLAFSSSLHLLLSVYLLLSSQPILLCSLLFSTINERHLYIVSQFVRNSQQILLQAHSTTLRKKEKKKASTSCIM